MKYDVGVSGVIYNNQPGEKDVDFILVPVEADSPEEALAKVANVVSAVTAIDPPKPDIEVKT